MNRRAHVFVRMLGGIFDLVIALSPPGFRREYGSAMREDFAQAIASEFALHGWFAAVTYGCEAIVDLLTTALREYAAMFARDFTYALRALRKTPSFTAIVVLTLSLAIGANAAIFSILRTVVLAPLPFAEPDRLITFMPTRDPRTRFSLPAVARIVRETSQVGEAAAFTTLSGTFSGHGALKKLDGVVVTPDFFRTLGVTPLLGHFPARHEVGRGIATTIVISEQLYRSAFGANPKSLGSMVTVDGKNYRLIGVVPATFTQPLPTYGFLENMSFWRFVPDDGMGTEYNSDYTSFDVVARLAPSATVASAQAAIDAVAARIHRHDPVHESGLGVRVVDLTDSLIGSARPLLFAIFAAVFAVLLVACANVANLLLSRAASRDREFSVRVAIGASRGQIIAQLLIETFALAAVGGVIGAAIAYGVVRAFVGSSPPNIPRVDLVSVDGPAIAYTCCVVAFCTFAAGLAPAFTMAQRDVAITLKNAGRGGDAHHGAKARSVLAASEIAITLALVVAAGLVLRSFVTLTSQPLGFDPHRVTLVGPVDLSDRRYANSAVLEAFLDRALQRVKDVPGVLDASWGFGIPFGHGYFQSIFSIAGQHERPGSEHPVKMAPVGAEFFSTMRTAMRAGRSFSQDDRVGAAPVVIVNQTFARTFFGRRSPIGAYITPAVPSSDAHSPRRRIVGVVTDLRQSFKAAIEPTIYLPIRQLPFSVVDLVIRTLPGSDPGPAAAEAIAASDPLLPKPDVISMDDTLATNVAVQRLTVSSLCALAVVALALSIAGVFAVVSYGVTQRTHEFGVRMALGADARHIVRTVVASAMRLSLAGIVGGLIAAAAGTRLLSDELYETQPLDPLTFACVTLLVLVAAFCAALVPARRATRVDPIVALRYE